MQHVLGAALGVLDLEEWIDPSTWNAVMYVVPPRVQAFLCGASVEHFPKPKAREACNCDVQARDHDSSTPFPVPRTLTWGVLQQL
jgi:hypothetical protein